MPTYVYQLRESADAAGCAHCREGFETFQRMRDAALTACPACGAPVEKVIQPAMLGNIGGKLRGPGEGALQKAGFTQYKRAGKGQYEKSFGKGPSTLGGGG